VSDIEIHNSSLLAYQFDHVPPGLNDANDSLGDNMARVIDHSEPSYIYMANGRIHDLETVVHSKQEQKLLNNQHVHVYLYEPLCSYIVDDEFVNTHTIFNNGFYSEFPNSIDLDKVRAAELDSVLIYANNNNLNNVVVHTGDYNVADYYPHYTPHIKLVCNDLFLKSYTFVDRVLKEPKPQFQKKFISTNWRFTAHRAIISSILCKKSCHLSWFYQFKPEILNDTPWFDINHQAKAKANYYKKLVMSVDKLNASSPWSLDLKAYDTFEVEESVGHYYPNSLFEDCEEHFNPVFHNRDYATLQQFYRESFVDIVCESRYAQPTGNLSEKTLQPIHFMTPFVLVAPPYSLQYLREFGFETFHRWWDESYDFEENHSARMQKIVDIIEMIDSWSNEKTHAVYTEMTDVLNHNYNMLDEVFGIIELAPDDPGFTVYQQWISKDHGILGDDNE